MKQKEIKGRNQYHEITDLQDAELWEAFEYQGKNLRTVPVEVNGTNPVCRSCFFFDSRMNKFANCKVLPICCAHTRKDKISVKYINADINCIGDERNREMAKLADLKNRW